MNNSRNRKKFSTWLLMAAVVGVVGISSAIAQGRTPDSTTAELTAASEILSPSTAKSSAQASSATKAPAMLARALRTRTVGVDLAALRALGDRLVTPDKSETLRMRFFDDAPLLIDIIRVEPTASGGRAYIGRIADIPYSMAVLVDNDGVVSMNVTAGTRKFSVVGTRETGYFASELRDQSLPDHSVAPPEYHFSSTRSTDKDAPVQARSQEVAADTGATMDVMVIYTNTARLQHGGTAQMNAAVDAQVALTNQMYADSNVVQRLRLVYKGEVTHVEASSSTDLTRMEAVNDGYLDSIPVLRDLYAADFVSLWGNYPDTCGLGSLMATESSSFAPVAYNVVNSPACTVGNSATFAHELGHNMGLRHDNYMDTASTSVTPEAGGAATTVGYAHGYVDLTNRFRTVMAYNDQCVAQMPTFNCTRVLRFSNPALTYNNSGSYAPASPTAPSGNAGNAHERQALNDTRETTANFRQGLASFTGPGILVFLPTTYSVTEGAGTVTLFVARHVGSTGAVAANFTTANGSATAGSDYTSNNNTLSWADGDTSVKTITVNIAQDALLEGRETFTVTLSGATGGASIGSAGGMTSTATVSIIDDDPDTFPAGGVVPADYLQATPAKPWGVDLGDGYLSQTSLQSAQVFGPNQSTYANADLDYTGNFVAGNVSFAYKVSTYSTLYGVLEFYVDGVLRFTSAGGETGWLTRTEAVTAGAHTLRWRFKNRLDFSCATVALPSPPAPGGANCADRAWIDGVVLPLTGNTLSVLKGGTGTGTVTGSGINCGVDCMETAAAGTMITLTAAPSGDSSFVGWSGAGCSGTGTCSVTLSSSQNVTATFNILPEAFPPSCGAPPGWTTPAGATAGWSVATDRERTGSCSMKSDPIPNAAAAGAPNATKAQIQVSGTYAAGNISFYYNVSSETGYDCLRFIVDTSQQSQMGNCNGQFSNGGFGASGDISTWTQISIPVTAGFHTFIWSYEKDNIDVGGADAAWIDDVTLPPLAPVTLTAAKSGTGAGTITGTGINCGVDCTEDVAGGTIVTLTATPAGGSNFTGWSGGGCSGTSTCVVTVNTATTVTATFVLQQFNLNVSRDGTGTGTVTSAPAGINCGATCTFAFNAATPVTLTATPQGGSTFAAWSGGGCSGTGTCAVTMNAITNVTATFNILLTAPAAPTIGAATPGNTVASIAFTAPGSNGGSAILDYTVTCGGGSSPAIGLDSPITVTGLNNNQLYTCSVTARNAIGNGNASGTVNVTPIAGAALALVSVKSRKAHGGLGSFDVPITHGIALGGLVSVEPRSSTSHAIVFRMNNTVTVPGSASVVDAGGPIGSVSSPVVGADPRDVIVTLTGIPDNKRVTVTLTGVNGAFNTSASMGFLVGDINSNRAVNASDISAVKARQSLTVNNDTTALHDLIPDGAINQTDVSAAKARSGRVIP